AMYPLSLHDALPIFLRDALADVEALAGEMRRLERAMAARAGDGGGAGAGPEAGRDAGQDPPAAGIAASAAGDPYASMSLEEIMDRYARASERFERAGGYEAEARLRAAAFGLGFREEDLARRI